MTGRAFLLFAFLASSSAAQSAPLDAGPPTLMQSLRVHVSFASGGSCDSFTHADLVGRNGSVAQGFANSQCVIEFRDIPAGDYRLIVSGHGVANTDTGSVVVNSSDTRDLEVRVTRAGQPSHADVFTATASVAAADLKIPRSAAKEFDKANELIARQDWQKAIASLDKAVSLYPDYAAAYNNLGVVYAHTRDRARESDALNKAIAINDHFAPAYVNLARMSISASDFAGAETQLNKAFAFDPTDAMTLVLLTYSEFMNKHLDDAISTCRRAHALSQPHAFVHFVAARALEQKNQPAEALAELRFFLQEEQTGSRADAARKELAKLEALPR
jgi:tetratricopeptide (TPR) repeat protein